MNSQVELFCIILGLYIYIALIHITSCYKIPNYLPALRNLFKNKKIEHSQKNQASQIAQAYQNTKNENTK